jgi:fibronectin-binding autotransporter adhesin
MKKQYFFSLLLLLALIHSGVNATVRYVRNAASGTGNGSTWANASNDLQLVIDQSATGDEVWVATGFYRPTRLHYNTATISPNNRQNSFMMKSGVKIYGGFSGNEASLAQRNWQANQTFLDGDIGTISDSTDNCYSVVRSMGPIGSGTLDGFLIRYGNANGPSANLFSGGGMYIFQSNPTVANCRFIENAAVDGGALYCGNGSTPFIYNCQFQSNVASDKGGAINGYIPGAYTLVRCWFGNNRASSGGAIANEYSIMSQVLTLKHCVFQGNYASAPGASGGGAIYNYTDIYAEYTNCTFAGNRAAAYGGAIYTVSAAGGDQLRNCIVWGNIAGTSGNNILDTFGATPAITYSIIEGGFSGAGNSSANPGFVAPAAAALAPTMSGDYKVLRCSPAINTGSNSYLSIADSLDLPGSPRIQHATVDMGGYEHTYTNIVPDANGVVFVNGSNPPNGNGSSWINAVRELADALKAAESNTSIQQIWVAAGTYRPLYAQGGACVGTSNRNRTFELPGFVDLYGGFAGNETSLAQRNWGSNTTVLSGDVGIWNDTSDNAYHVVYSSGTFLSDASTLDGFTITQGNAGAGSGGGIYCYQSSVHLKNCTVTGNYAYWGSAAYIFYSQGSIKNCLISSNRAYDGATLHFFNYSFFDVSNTVISGNTSLTGAVRTHQSDTRFSSCIFSGNKSTASYFSSPATGMISGQWHTNLSFMNCSFSGNQINFGALLTNDGNSTCNMRNSILWGNAFGQGLILNTNNSTDTIMHSVVEGGYTGAGNINTDPQFLSMPPTSAAPFTTGSYRLQHCSPAINTGNNSYLSAADTTDITGQGRIRETLVDRGAYEFAGARPDANGIVYVDSSKVSSGSGNSWANAVKELADALKAAHYDTAIHQVWVAKGTYKPLYTADSMSCNGAEPRNKAFVMAQDLKIYGGFVGNETSIVQRNIPLNKTTLSGDIGIAGNKTDNCFHVMIASNITGNNVVDGLSITGGYSSSLNAGDTIRVNGFRAYKHMGAGIYLAQATLQVSNCTISGNEADYGGGVAFYGHGPDANAGSGFTNCVISGNVASNGFYPGGGGIYRFSSWSTVDIINCTVTGNRAVYKGAGFAQVVPQGSLTRIKNSIFWLNDAAQGDDNLDTSVNATIAVSDCIIEGGYRAGTNIITDHPMFFTGLNPANAPATTGDFHLGLCSPAINAGNNSSIPAGVIRDMDGNPRWLQDKVDLGAYETNGLTLPGTAGDSIASTIYCTGLDSSYLAFDNWYNFYQTSSGKLILSINDSSQSMIPPYTASAKLRILYNTNSTTIMNNPFGQTGFFYPMNRSWSFSVNTALTHPVSVRFYFMEQDSADIAALYGFGSLQNLVVYKVNGTNPYNTLATGYKQYTYAAVADTNHYTLGSYQGKRYAEFKVTGFSSGTMALVSAIPLAIHLGDFSGVNMGDKNLLEWNTLDEQEGDYFEIERSGDGKTFSKSGAQPAKGSGAAQYKFWDEMPLAGNNYYRLTMISKDGKRDYSRIVRLFVSKDGAIAIELYPNPVKNTLQVDIKGPLSGKAFLSLVDMTGRILLHKPVTTASEQLDMQSLSPGIYQVRYTDGQRSINLKCVKE